MIRLFPIHTPEPENDKPYLKAKIELNGLLCRFCGARVGYTVIQHASNGCGIVNMTGPDDDARALNIHLHFFCRCGRDYIIDYPKRSSDIEQAD